MVQQPATDKRSTDKLPVHVFLRSECGKSDSQTKKNMHFSVNNNNNKNLGVGVGVGKV